MLDQFIKMPVGKKVFILGLVVVVIGLAFWYTQISPAQEELKSLTSQYSRLETKLREVKKRKKTYDEDRKRRDDLEIASVKQRQILPSQTEMASFLNNINSMADLTGLEIVSVKPEPEAPADYYARIPVKLELKGSFHQLAKFFYQIGKLDRIINVENINIDRPTIDESGAVVSASALATTFRSLEVGKK